jgi:Bacterial PH domain
MTWLRWVGFVVAVTGIRWVIAHRGEETAAYIIAVLFVLTLLVGYLRHAHRQHAELTLMQADPQERAMLLSAMPPARAAEMRFTLRSFQDIDPSIIPAATEFTYPEASAHMTAILFWASAIFTVGMLLPILRGGLSDWSSAGMLLVLAALFFVTALGYRLTHRWAGTRLRVSPDGLTELSGDGTQRHIPWPEIVAVRYRRWLGALEYQAASGEQIRVGLSLRDFAHFAQLALIHLHRTSAASAT